MVDQRVAIMKSFGSALATAANYGQGKATAEAAKSKLAAARAGLPKVVNMFPRGTALGDRGVVQSRALSTIFTNRSDFEAKFERLDEGFAALDRALAGGKEATTGAAGTLRATCASCHNRYRAADD